MIIRFKSRLEGIDWIAENAKSEGHFEILREQLMFNFIYTNVYFLDLSEVIGEVALLDIQSPDPDNPFEA